MREWRKTHPVSETERRKGITRAYTRVLIKRGKIIPGSCVICGDEPAQAHHPDYANPRLVVWLCKSHHSQHHWRLKRGLTELLEA